MKIRENETKNIICKCLYHYFLRLDIKLLIITHKNLSNSNYETKKKQELEI